MSKLAERFVLMVVAGCGKSSVGAALSPVLGAVYVDGDDLHPAIIALAIALGHDAIKLSKGQVDDSAITRIHRLESDDLAFVNSLFTQFFSH